MSYIRQTFGLTSQGKCAQVPPVNDIHVSQGARQEVSGGDMPSLRYNSSSNWRRDNIILKV